MSKKSARANVAPTNTTSGTNMENQTQNDTVVTTQNELPVGDNTNVIIDGTDNTSGTNDNAGTANEEETTTTQNQAPLVVDAGINDNSTQNNGSDDNADVKELTALVDAAVDPVDKELANAVNSETVDFTETIDLPVVQVTNTTESPVKEAKVYAFGSIILDGAFKNLDVYIAAMGPGCMNDDQSGGRHQRSLRQSLLAIINNADETNYVAAFDALFNLLDTNSGFVFHEYNRFRFHDTMGLSAGEFNTWSRLLTGLVLVSNTKSRPVVSKQVAIADMLNEARLSASGNNLLSSYLGA